jgi:serine/threonine protein kinase/tetratricopeptide (TPR) repeat protein
VTFEAGSRLGPYEILAPIGAGGMGEVYRARDTRLGRDVAVKVLRAEVWRDELRLRRFEQETRAAGLLNHPNILSVYDVGTVEGAPFLVTELLEGETLRERLARPVAMREAVDYALQAARGLAAAHAKGIVHRDVKPENLFVRADGFVKILDFGLAKLDVLPAASDDSGAETLVRVDTAPGTMMGTIRYMAPEQVRGLEVDARADVFGLGAVLYETLAGEPPFAGPTSGDVIVAILEREPRPLTGVPALLGAIVRRALSKQLATRYPSAAELCTDLEGLSRRLDASESLESTTPSGARRTVIRSAARRRSKKPIDSLAVLPLANEGGDPEAEYLCDGVTETIINDLARIPKLRVVSRATVFRYKGLETDPIEAGHELGVRAVLSGRVVQLGDTLVVRAELVDVAADAQVWGGQFKGRLTDIFELEERIASEICEQLRLKLTGDERRRLGKRYTESTEAYHLYLKGRYCLNNRRTAEWLRKGISYFQQASVLDPNYALAYAGLADAYGFLASSTGGVAPTDAYPKAKAAAMRALELDEDLPEAHTALGFFRLLYDWDWAGAGESFRRAVELNPNSAPAHDGYGFYFKVTGRGEEAIAECERALGLDPLSLFQTCSLGWAYYFARRPDRAVEYGHKALEMDASFPVAYWNMGLAHELMGQYERAIECFQRGAALSDRALTFVAHLGRACALAGRSVEAQMAMDELEEQATERYVSSYFFAIVHLGLGEYDRAFTWLERAFGERSGFLAFLGVEPMFDAVRDDPRFVDLCRRVRIDGYLSGDAGASA